MTDIEVAIDKMFGCTTPIPVYLQFPPFQLTIERDIQALAEIDSLLECDNVDPDLRALAQRLRIHYALRTKAAREAQ